MTLWQSAVEWLKTRGIELPARPITLAYQLIKRERDMASKDKGPKAAQQTRGPVGHWDDLMPPPTFEQAFAGVQAAYAALTGGDKLRGAYGAEVGILFATATIPHKEHPLMTADRGAVDEDHARQVLEGALAMHSGGTRDATAFPWATLLPILVSLLQQWLSHRTANA